MIETEPRIRVAFAATGVANLASIMAAFRRAGAEPYLAKDAEDLEASSFAVVPGVGSFGSAMAALLASGMDEAVVDRASRGAPTMGVCAGMQLFFEASEESPGVRGMSIVKGELRRFPSSLPVPQLGWNRVRRRGDATSLVRDGWAYFANSYRLTSLPDGIAGSWAEYGESFVAAAERPGLLLCQFHPELSGPWGQGLIERWLKQTGGQA
jgi:imidazole glycerol phosphate synthase glutamine amidotransferase subunit